MPTGGSYTPPPPPGGGMPPPAPAGGGQLDFAGLFQSWINAVTKPNASTYEAEIPNANWVKVLIGIAVTAVAGFLVNLIFAGAAVAQIDQSIAQLRGQAGTEGIVSFLETIRGYVGGGGAISALIFPFISFFVGAGIQYLFAKMLGGQGQDFMVHSYLSSLSYAPLHTAANLLQIIPLLGGCVAFVLSLYQIYSVGLSMQASQRLAPGRAQLAAFLPVIIGIVISCLCVILAIMGIASIAGNTNP